MMRQRHSLRANLGHLRDQAIDTAVAESRTRAARAEREKKDEQEITAQIRSDGAADRRDDFGEH